MIFLILGMEMLNVIMRNTIAPLWCIYVDESLDQRFSFIQSLLGIMIDIITNVMLYVS